MPPDLSCSCRHRWVNVFEKELQPGSSNTNMPLHPKTCRVRGWGTHQVGDTWSGSAPCWPMVLTWRCRNNPVTPTLFPAWPQPRECTQISSCCEPRWRNGVGNPMPGGGLEVQGEQSHLFWFSRRHASCRKQEDGSLSRILFCLSMYMSGTLSAFSQSRSCPW